jgi:hypothetical protein
MMRIFQCKFYYLIIYLFIFVFIFYRLVAHIAINNDNAKTQYMYSSLVKKYFRLSVALLKYKPCKSFMNSKPPEDDQSFLIMQQIHIKEKKDLYKNLELEKRLDKTKTLEELNAENNSILNKNDNNFYNEDSSIVNSSSILSSKLSNDNRAKTFQKITKDNPFNLNQIEKDQILPKNKIGYKRSLTKIDEIAKLKKRYFSERENNFSKSINKIEEISEENCTNIKIMDRKITSFNKSYLEDDRNSLFNPENTKNKNNLNDNDYYNENDNIDNISYENHIREKSDLLILRENNNQNNSIPIEKISSLSSRILKRALTEKHFYDQYSNSNDKKLEKSNDNYIENENENVVSDSRKHSNNSNIGSRIFPNMKKSFNKTEEKNLNIDLSINVQTILIENLR